METFKYLIYISDQFNNELDGGIIKAKDTLRRYKETNRPFLEKHPEYEEEYNIAIKEITTDLEYFIRKKDIDGSKED